MSHPYYHALSAARTWGGIWQDYMAIEQWFDQTKSHVANFRHRLILHNTFGMQVCQQVFGAALLRASDGVEVAVAEVGAQHVREDFGGQLPSARQCVESAAVPEWMEPPRHRLGRIAARRFGGIESDYTTLEAWFDLPLEGDADLRCQLLVLHSFGIFLCEQVCGPVIARASDGRQIPTRVVAEAYVAYRTGGRIPALGDVLQSIPLRPWMGKGAQPLSQLLSEEVTP